MHYLGGKFRIRKQIAEYLRSVRKPDQLYVEPFVGAAWVLQEMDGLRQASDVCEDLILLYRALQEGWDPPTTISEEEYKTLRHAPPSALRGFVGFGCSFSGKWFGGYARDKRGDDYCGNARNSLIKQRPLLNGVSFSCAPYQTLNPHGALIYCDPPYNGTTTYAGAPTFSAKDFWGRMRDWSITNTVLISEYTAPDDFEAVLHIPTKTEIRTKDGRANRVEKLFRYRGLR